MKLNQGKKIKAKITAGRREEKTVFFTLNKSYIPIWLETVIKALIFCENVFPYS